MQPSNFLLKKDNPLTAAAQRARAAAPASVFDSLTGAYMAQSAGPAAQAPAAEAEAPYEGGWLKGIDFGCSNEAPPGALLCKMTVRGLTKAGARAPVWF